MKQIGEQTITQPVINDVFCDICEKSCKTEYGFEYMSLAANWGFMSNKDLEQWEAQVCEACVDEKLSFIPFKKNIRKF